MGRDSTTAALTCLEVLVYPHGWVDAQAGLQGEDKGGEVAIVGARLCPGQRRIATKGVASRILCI